MFSFLMALNMQNQGRGQAKFVPRSHLGLPKPWFEIPMHIGIGDAWCGDSRTAHFGGGWASMGTGTPRYRYCLFVGFKSKPWNYLDTWAVTRPAWATDGAAEQQVGGDDSGGRSGSGGSGGEVATSSTSVIQCAVCAARSGLVDCPSCRVRQLCPRHCDEECPDCIGSAHITQVVPQRDAGNNRHFFHPLEVQKMRAASGPVHFADRNSDLHPRCWDVAPVGGRTALSPTRRAIRLPSDLAVSTPSLVPCS